MADLDLSALNSALGAYYRQNKKTIMAKFYALEEARKMFTVISGVQDEYVLTEMEVAEMMQPYQTAWTPKGTVSFKPEIIKARPVKVDFPFTPKALEASWIGFLKTNNSSPEEYPFVKYIYEKIIERVIRDLNSCIINGVYVAPTPGTPGAAATSFNGLRKVVVDAIAAGKITAFATGALSTANIVDKVEALCDSVDEQFKGQPLTLIMSNTWKTAYFRRKRADFGGNTDYSAEKTLVDFTNVEIKTPTYMNGSNRLIISPPSNILLVEDGVNEEEKMIVQANRRELEVMMDFKRGVGFGIIEGQVWANDQA
jgi:hypothetical protein